MLKDPVRDAWIEIDSAITNLSALRRDFQQSSGFRLVGKIDYELAALARHYLRIRRARDRAASHLFHDPAWDMLLDLFAATIEGKEISVSSLCIASAAPTTTALRHIGKLVQAGLVKRYNSRLDRRIVFVTITGKGSEIAARFLSDLAGPVSSAQSDAPHEPQGADNDQGSREELVSDAG